MDRGDGILFHVERLHLESGARLKQFRRRLALPVGDERIECSVVGT
jgi:hypothetical protein